MHLLLMLAAIVRADHGSDRGPKVPVDSAVRPAMGRCVAARHQVLAFWHPGRPRYETKLPMKLRGRDVTPVCERAAGFSACALSFA